MGHNNIRIERFDLHHEQERLLLPKLITCYQNVFAEGPWHEWKKCPECAQYWGIKDKELLHRMNFSHCGVPLEDYWKTEDVEKNIHEAFVHDISCFIAICDGEIIGFCWGYIIDIKELENYFGIGIIAQIEDRWGSHITVYQSEMGVVPSFQDKKVGKRMFRARHFEFLEKRADIGIARVRKYPEPSKTYNWFKKLGYETIASYPIADGRVILAKKLNEVVDI